MNHFDAISLEQNKPGLLVDRLPEILGELSYAEENNCLQVVYDSVIFFIHFNEGQLVYATNSLAPFERLERHLRRLSNQNPAINNEIIKQPRLEFKNDLRTYLKFPTDYQSIIWLLEKEHINREEAITLIRRITREVFESFICLSDDCKYKLVPRTSQIKELCRFELNAYISQCQKRIEAWQGFDDKVWSTYQRPYLVSVQDQMIDGLTKQQNETICKLLKGLNFRQISAVIDRDELIVAKILYPSMLENTIVMRDPKSPFDQLPNIPQRENVFELESDSSWRGEDSTFQVNSHSKKTVHALEKTWKIAYVDNDLIAHRRLKECLQQDWFSVLVIEDAMEAFTQLIEFQPSLILLGAYMPELSGYELCRLLKSNSDFQNIPIIVVNEAPELINEAKSKRVGAKACLAKPFERNTLLDQIWQYLE